MYNCIYTYIDFYNTIRNSNFDLKLSKTFHGNIIDKRIVQASNIRFSIHVMEIH
jgi:hypothetical protein